MRHWAASPNIFALTCEARALSLTPVCACAWFTVLTSKRPPQNPSLCTAAPHSSSTAHRGVRHRPPLAGLHSRHLLRAEGARVNPFGGGPFDAPEVQVYMAGSRVKSARQREVAPLVAASLRLRLFAHCSLFVCFLRDRIWDPTFKAPCMRPGDSGRCSGVQLSC